MLKCDRKLYLDQISRGIMIPLLIVLLLYSALSPLCTLAAEDDAPTIRVGFPIQKGLTEIDETGRLSGYTYDFLQEIAQYTGWRYEFVQMPDLDLNDSLTQMLEMLEKGELDLLGGMAYNDTVYDFPGYHYGTAYSTLQVLNSNTAINESNYQTLPVIRVAAIKTATNRKNELVKFCETNDLTLELIDCATEQEQFELLYQGRADAMLNVDLNYLSEVRTIAKFAPQPYYLATTKGNSTIVNNLNMAISKINESDPYLMIRLYEKYFAPQKAELYLSDSEKQYIERAGALDAIFVSGKAPFQYLDEEGILKGIAPDFLDYITEKTGLQFNKICAGNQQEFLNSINQGKVDLAVAIPSDTELTTQYEVSLTRSYVSSQVTMALNKRVSSSDLKGKRLALPSGLTYPGEYSGVVTEYDTIEDCIAAVNSGKADYCYGNGYSVQYYANQEQYKNIYLVPQSMRMQDMCLGVTKPVDVNLLTILNKVIASIPENTRQAIVYNNISSENKHITLSAYVNANPWQAISLVGILFLVILGTLLFYLYLRIQNSRKVSLDNERYKKLFDLSNEYIFEYRFTEDRLILSEKCAQVFQCDSVIEHYYETILTGPLQDTEPYLKTIYIKVLTENQSGSEEAYVQMPDGTRRWFRITFTLVYDKMGNTVSTIGKVTDIQAEKEEKEKLMTQAQMDSLTNIYNPAAFREVVTEYLASDVAAKGSALLVMDIDHFKTINDRFGHFIGDQILKKTADQMKVLIEQKNEVLGRLGGDEFLIFLKDVNHADQVSRKCQELNTSLSAALRLEDGTNATVSIGAAIATADLDYDQLYQKADSALYSVKSHGRNGYEVVS